MRLYQITMNVRKDSRRATDRQKPQNQKVQEQAAEVATFRPFCSLQAPITAHQSDAALPDNVDPYRIEFGMSEGALVAWILGIIFVGFGIFVAVMMVLNPRLREAGRAGSP